LIIDPRAMTCHGVTGDPPNTTAPRRLDADSSGYSPSSNMHKKREANGEVVRGSRRWRFVVSV
jgi:hypothetical protein